MNPRIIPGLGLSIGFVLQIIINTKIRVPLNLVLSFKGHTEKEGSYESYIYQYIEFMPEVDICNTRTYSGRIRHSVGLPF